MWSEVANRLRDCLGKPGDMSDSSARYRRSRRAAQLVFALDRGGRAAEATELLRVEASVTWDWVRVVDRMLALGDVDAANTAAIEGLAGLPEQQRGERAGLRDRLRQIADRRGDHDKVAAFRADEFFEDPSLETFEVSLDTARRVGCEGRVRSWMEHFLCTGRCPVGLGFRRRKGEPLSWPLPASGDGIKPQWSVNDGLELLRDIAIKEKRSPDVLRFHDQLLRGRRGRRTWIGGDYDELRVADAVAGSHPERAMEIYRAHVDRLLSRANTKVYALVASLLVKIGKLMGRKRGAEWEVMLSRLREQHARKRNFIQELDRVAKSPLDVARQRRSERR